MLTPYIDQRVDNPASHTPMPPNALKRDMLSMRNMLLMDMRQNDDLFVEIDKKMKVHDEVNNELKKMFQEFGIEKVSIWKKLTKADARTDEIEKLSRVQIEALIKLSTTQQDQITALQKQVGALQTQLTEVHASLPNDRPFRQEDLDNPSVCKPASFDDVVRKSKQPKIKMKYNPQNTGNTRITKLSKKTQETQE